MVSQGHVIGKRAPDVSNTDIYDDHEDSLLVGNYWGNQEYEEAHRPYDVGPSLIDPLLQDLDRVSRHYLNYCE